MAAKQASRFCGVCNQQSLFQKPGINHILHLILSVVTLGIWLVVWGILAAVSASKPMRCTRCGSPPGLSAPPSTPAVAPANPVE